MIPLLAACAASDMRSPAQGVSTSASTTSVGGHIDRIVIERSSGTVELTPELFGAPETALDASLGYLSLTSLAPADGAACASGLGYQAYTAWNSYFGLTASLGLAPADGVAMGVGAGEGYPFNITIGLVDSRQLWVQDGVVLVSVADAQHVFSLTGTQVAVGPHGEVPVFGEPEDVAITLDLLRPADLDSRCVDGTDYGDPAWAPERVCDPVTYSKLSDCPDGTPTWVSVDDAGAP